MNRAFFLDRDGTINVDYNYVHTKEEWTWCDGAIDAIRWMNDKGFKVIVVTNQSGISKGKYSETDVRKLHRWVDKRLNKNGTWVDAWYIAPYHPEFQQKPFYPPEDRKPGKGMFLKAKKEFNIDFSRSYMAGDKITDLKPAVNLGITSFFIKSRHEPYQSKNWLKVHNIRTFDNIGQVVTEL